MSWTPFQFHQYESRRAPKKPIAANASNEPERQLHDKIEAELKRLRWYYVHSRMDQSTTTQLGVTDFIIAVPGGRTLWLEVKRKGGKLSQEQNIARHILTALGHWHEVAYSFEDFLTICRQ